MVFQYNSRTKWKWYLRTGCYNLRECWGRHFPFFDRIWLTPQFEDKASSSFFSREKWVQLDAGLALLPSCQASLFIVYGHHLYNSWGSRKGGTYRLSVIRVGFGVYSFVLFHVLQGKMGAPHSRKLHRVQSWHWLLIMHLYICFCIEFLRSSPCLLEKSGKSLSKLAGEEKISVEMPTFLHSTWHNKSVSSKLQSHHKGGWACAIPKWMEL